MQTSGSAALPASAHTCVAKLRSIQHTQPVCKLCLCLRNLGVFLAGNQAFGRISQAFKTHRGAGAVSTCAPTAQRDGQGEGAAAAGGEDGAVQAAKADFLGSHLAFFSPPRRYFLSNIIKRYWIFSQRCPGERAEGKPACAVALRITDCFAHFGLTQNKYVSFFQ